MKSLGIPYSFVCWPRNFKSASSIARQRSVKWPATGWQGFRWVSSCVRTSGLQNLEQSHREFHDGVKNFAVLSAQQNHNGALSSSRGAVFCAFLHELETKLHSKKYAIKSLPFSSSFALEIHECTHVQCCWHFCACEFWQSKVEFKRVEKKNREGTPYTQPLLKWEKAGFDFGLSRVLICCFFLIFCVREA